MRATLKHRHSFVEETIMSNTDLMQQRHSAPVKQPESPASGPQSQTSEQRLKPDVHSSEKKKESDVAPERDESEQLRHHQ
jgi:hypothetical protein